MLPSKFYPLVDDVAWIEKFVPIGVNFIQLRLKEKPCHDLVSQITAALDIGREYGADIVINDYWDIAIELGAQWVHLGQSDLDGADIPALKTANIKFGTSSHNHAELDRALSFDPDYVALGPIYETVSKAMVMDAQGLDRLGEWKTLLNGKPLVGIGGVRLETAQNVLDAGADTVSCIGDVLLHANPEERVKAWLTQIA